jgi:hypothetical protein
LARLLSQTAEVMTCSSIQSLRDAVSSEDRDADACFDLVGVKAVPIVRFLEWVESADFSMPGIPPAHALRYTIAMTPRSARLDSFLSEEIEPSFHSYAALR